MIKPLRRRPAAHRATERLTSALGLAIASWARDHFAAPRKVGHLRLLIVDNAAFVGGAQVNLRHMARIVGQRGHQVAVAVPPDASGQLVEHYRSTGADLTYVNMGRRSEQSRGVGGRGLAEAVAQLVHAISRTRADVVFASSQRAGMLSALARPLTGTRVVWRLCDMGVARSRKMMTVLVDRGTCVSHAVYRSYEGLPRRHFRVVHTGVWAPDLSEAARRSTREAVRAELGIPLEAPVVGAVCNLQHWKGFHVVLAAFRDVLRRVPDAWLVHLGGPVPAYPDYPAHVRRLAADLGVEDRVRQVGFKFDPLPYYASFDAFTHLPVPERGVLEPEAFGQVATEAMAYHLPVVAARLGGLPEIVEAGQTGALVEPGDGPTAGDVLAGLLLDPTRAARWGEAGHERYRAHFTIEREIDDYMRVFGEMGIR
jgi:glycosyltransferase involved in cell wall biosynthesis